VAAEVLVVLVVKHQAQLAGDQAGEQRASVRPAALREIHSRKLGQRVVR